MAFDSSSRDTRAGLPSVNSHTTHTLGSPRNCAAGEASPVPADSSPTGDRSARSGDGPDVGEGADEPVVGQPVGTDEPARPIGKLHRLHVGDLGGRRGEPDRRGLSASSPASSRSTTTVFARRRPTIVGYRGANAVSAMVTTAGSGTRSRSKPPSTIRRATTLVPSSSKDSQPVACGHPSRAATSGPT